MSPESHSQRRRAVDAARIEWGEIGVVGRVAFAGVVLSLAVAVGLGVWLPRLVRQHLLQARAELIATIGDEIAARGLVPVGPPTSPSYERLREEIELSLLGGETTRVKLWTNDGTVAYSDEPRLVGLRFDLTPAAERALRGSPTFAISDHSEPAHALERPIGEVMEFFVPVHSRDGATVGVFEVEQRADALNASLGDVRRNVWLAIGTGIGLLGIFMASLAVSSARVLNRRRRQAEHLLGSLFHAQEDERRRTVGALHDDVGQPLFRLLYGLEGSRAKLPPDHPARRELEHLSELTRDIDRTIRSELRTLHRGVDEDLGLASSIEQIVDTAMAETDLVIDLDIGDVDASPLGQAPKIALVHAVREAIINVRKHANATHVVVELRCAPQGVVVSIRDDGVGARAPEGLGLVTTRERLEALGGRLKVTSTRGRGTVFRATVPISGGSP
jgi:signal transduction histidine kinase